MSSRPGLRSKQHKEAHMGGALLPMIRMLLSPHDFPMTGRQTIVHTVLQRHTGVSRSLLFPFFPPFFCPNSHFFFVFSSQLRANPLHASLSFFASSPSPPLYLSVPIRDSVSHFFNPRSSRMCLSVRWVFIFAHCDPCLFLLCCLFSLPQSLQRPFFSLSAGPH